jgi:hypothetical protein
MEHLVVGTVSPERGFGMKQIVYLMKERKERSDIGREDSNGK